MILRNIKKEAEKKGISIGEIEKKAGLSNGAIFKWRNSSPTVEKLKAVANVLGITVDDLIREDRSEEV